MHKSIKLLLLIIAFISCCFTAERPRKKRKILFDDLMQYSPDLQKILRLSCVIGTYKLSNITHHEHLHLLNLKNERKQLVQNLTDQDYVKYLRHRFPGKIIVGDELPYEEFLHDRLSPEIRKMIAQYLCQWVNPEDSGLTVGPIDNPICVLYKAATPFKYTRVAPTSSRQDYESLDALRLISVELFEAQNLLQRYVHQKPSEQELQDMRASKKYSEKVLKLLKEDKLFSFPAIEDKKLTK